MNDIKITASKNITKLRQLNNMTQSELAEKLNYSDKTVSKWERGESLPDISVLCRIADFFGVSLDALVRDENINEKIIEASKEKKQKKPDYNRKAVSYICEAFVFFLALFAFIITTLITKQSNFAWLYFIYACPVFLIVKLIFNTIWFNPRHNYFIISALMWASLATIHITCLYFKINVSLIYLLGTIGQVIILLWSLIKKRKMDK